ncbi:MAG TPA: glycosyltransferase [Cyclobacteriaceae bacterium]|nr:glycosyltransferase [Cyclobacteriaceae bacterium]
MSKDNVVSIIMPAYNAGKYIGEAIESIQLQTYSLWELIVVDDESTDETADIVKKYTADKRIKYLWQKNGKQGKARNRGLNEAIGEYIAFLDADDVWLPKKLENQISLLKETQTDLVFGYSWLIKNDVRTNDQIGRGLEKYQGSAAIEFLLFHDAFIMSTVMVTARAIKQVKGFVEDSKIQYCEDWHIWLKLAFENFSFYTDAKVVSYYRLHENSAAAVELNAPAKFFYALIDLHERYKSNTVLASEIKKRGAQLVFHHKLNSVLVDTILAFLKTEKELNGFESRMLKTIYGMNTALFRKAFLSYFKYPSS